MPRRGRVGTKPRSRAACASRQPATRTAPSRSIAGVHAAQSANGWSGGRPALPGRRRARAVVGGRSLGLRQRLGSRATRSAPKNTRYGCCVGCLKWRWKRWSRIAVPPSAIGKRSRQSCRAWARPRYATSSGFGRCRGSDGVVRGTGTTIASSGASSSTERLSMPEERLGMRHGRRAGEGRRRGQLERQRVVDPLARGRRIACRRGETASARRDPPPRPRTLEGRSSARRVEHERRSDHRHLGPERMLEGDGQLPAGRRRRLEQDVPRPRTAVGDEAASSVAGPPWKTVSAAVTVTTTSVSTNARLTRNGTVPAELDERASSAASCTTTCPRNRRANSGATKLELTPAGPASEAGGDEDRLSVERHADAPQLVDRRLDRRLGADRAASRGSAAPAARQRSSPGPRARLPPRAARRRAGTAARHGRPHPRPRRRGPARRTQHDTVRRHVHQPHAGADEQRDAIHVRGSTGTGARRLVGSRAWARTATPRGSSCASR